MPREELAVVIRKLQKNGKKVVFTNGVFDLVHAGHVRLLKKAKKYGNVLVIGMNSDSSVRMIKGPKRPIVEEKYRAELLCSLQPIDYVTIFSEATPEKTIELLKPDVHVKGGDWKAESLPEAKIVRSYGGQVVIENSQCDITTSTIIKKIIDVYSKG